jgi:hypothetical protein
MKGAEARQQPTGSANIHSGIQAFPDEIPSSEMESVFHWIGKVRSVLGNDGGYFHHHDVSQFRFD